MDSSILIKCIVRVFLQSLTNSRGSWVAGPKSRSRVQSRGRGSNVEVGQNDLEFEVLE